MHYQWSDDRRKAKNYQDIENIAPHYIPNGNSGLANKRRLDVGRQLRRAGTKGDHCQADNEWRNTDFGRQACRAAYQPFCAENEEN